MSSLSSNIKHKHFLFQSYKFRLKIFWIIFLRCTKIECGLFAGKVLNKRRIIGILKTFVTYNFHITRRTNSRKQNVIFENREFSSKWPTKWVFRHLSGPQNLKVKISDTFCPLVKSENSKTKTKWLADHGFCSDSKWSVTRQNKVYTLTQQHHLNDRMHLKVSRSF